MKLTVKKSALNSALISAALMPEEKGMEVVKLTAHFDGTIKLIAGTQRIDQFVMQIPLDGTVEEPGEFSPGLDRMKKSLVACKTPMVTLEADEQRLTVIDANGKSVGFVQLDGREIETTPGDVEWLHNTGFDATEFASALDAVSFCMADDYSRVYLQGVWTGETDGAFELVATDGHRLASQTIPGATVIPDEHKRLIPAWMVKVLARNLKAADRVCMTAGEWRSTDLEHASKRDWLRIQTDNGLRVDVQFGCSFPNYQQVFPTETDRETPFDFDLAHSIASALGTRAQMRESYFQVVDGVATVIDRDKNTVNEMAFDLPFDVGLYAQYTADIAKVLNGGGSNAVVKWESKTAIAEGGYFQNPMLIVSADKPGLSIVQMPCRI